MTEQEREVLRLLCRCVAAGMMGKADKELFIAFSESQPAQEKSRPAATVEEIAARFCRELKCGEITARHAAREVIKMREEGLI